MKICKPLYTLLIFIGVIGLLYINNSNQREIKSQLDSLKEVEFSLRDRLRSIITVRRDTLNLSNIQNFNDSVYYSFKYRIREVASIVLLISKNNATCYQV